MIFLRLRTAQTTGTTQYPQWGLRWDYDRYGNRLAQVVTAGSTPSNAVTVNPATNRITDPGYGYDAAGNMTADGLNTMVYDGESRVASSAQGGTTTTYAYDGKGVRVKKQVGAGTATVYVFSGSKVIAEYAAGGAAGSPLREYIYAGSQLVASIEGGVTKYHHADHLSARFTTDASGGSVSEQGHYPFGESWYTTGTASKWKFTTYERDGGTGESGNDYAMARYYVLRLGRFNAPDPVASSIADPQSLNRYSYVRNGPTNIVDPLGLQGQPTQPPKPKPSDPAPGWDKMPTWLEFFLSEWFGNPYEMNLLLHKAITGSHFGARYVDLPGRFSGVAQAEARYLEARIRNALRGLVRDNPECADLLGGLPLAEKLIDNLNLTQVDFGGWLTFDDWQAGTVWGVLTDANKPAGVYFGTLVVKNVGLWNQRAFTVYTNATFSGFGFTQKLTVIMHEMRHVRFGQSWRSSAIDRPDSTWDAVLIARVCGTGVP